MKEFQFLYFTYFHEFVECGGWYNAVKCSVGLEYITDPGSVRCEMLQNVCHCDERPAVTLLIRGDTKCVMLIIKLSPTTTSSLSLLRSTLRAGNLLIDARRLGIWQSEDLEIIIET